MSGIFGHTDPSMPRNTPGDNMYIGARYVPKFADPINWDKNKEYEPLTIVANGGNSYTSRKHVPAGSIEITNTEYWAMTGSFNQQVEQYRKEVQALQVEVQRNTTAITQIEENVDEINEKLDERNGLIVITDSYGSLSGGKSFVDLLRESNAYSPFYSKAKGGSGFGANTTYTALLTELAGEISKGDNEKISTILVCGGYNDQGVGSSQIETGINSFVQTAKTNFPYARVVIAFVGWGSATVHWSGLRNAKAVYSQCGKYGAEYMSGSEYILHNYSYFPGKGNFHPDQEGHNAIFNYIMSGLKTGSCSVSYPYTTLNITPDSNMDFSQTSGIACTLDNNLITLYGVNIYAELKTPKQVHCNGATRIKLADINSGLIWGSNSGLTKATCDIVIRDNTAGKYVPAQGVLEFFDGTINILPLVVLGDGSGYLNTAINEVQIFNIHETFDCFEV